MTRILSPEELQPTPVEQVDPSIVNPDQSVLLDVDPDVARPGLRAVIAQRIRGGVAEEQAVAPATTDETTRVPAQRATNNDSLFTPRIMTLEDSSDETSRILSVSPVSEGTKSIVVQPRIITLETTAEPEVETAAKEVAAQPIVQVETDNVNSATAIPGMAIVVKPVRRQKERPSRPKASVRKRERKAATAAKQAAVPTTAPVAEFKPSKGTKEAQKISMIGGLALAKMTGGRLAFRKPNLKLPRRNKAAEKPVQAEETVAPATPAVAKEKFSVMNKLNALETNVFFGVKKGVSSLNESSLNEKLYQRKGKLAMAIGAVAVVGIAYAAHKGFDIDFGNRSGGGVAPDVDGGAAQAAAEQAPTPEKFENVGVTPKGAGVSTAPIGSAEAAEIASALAETAEVQVAPELVVAEGAGFTELYQNTASQFGVELTGQEAYDIHVKMQTLFGGDIITGDTYMMSDGNYGISSPGKTTWNPDAQRFFEEQLEELKKKKTTS